ncbi:MAG: HK97 family phage prohead protease [Planctomycetes bacterium]|nr:HK97 family phage prohead protease [Planctomycetota bacterium]
MTTRNFELRAPVAWKLSKQDDEGKPRRFAMSPAYSGALFDFGWRSQAVIDLAGMEIPDSVPILLQHDASKYLGRADKLKAGDVLNVEGHLFDSDLANEVASLSDQGAQYQASVGIAINIDAIDYVAEESSAEVNGQTLQGPFVILRKTRLKEVSFVVLGADSNTSAAALSNELVAALDARLSTSPNPIKEAVMADKTDPLAAERERVKAIHETFASDPPFALECVLSGSSVLEAKAKYADRLQAKLADQEKKIADLEAKAAKPNPAGALSAVHPGASAADEGDPIDQWTAALAEESDRLMKLGHAANGEVRQGVKVSREAAIRAKAVANLSERRPDLHQAYLEALNGTEWTRRRREQHARQRQIRALGGRV